MPPFTFLYCLVCLFQTYYVEESSWKHNNPFSLFFCVFASLMLPSRHSNVDAYSVASVSQPLLTTISPQKSSIVQPVSNSSHYCQCQSSIETACFCCSKCERVPVAPTDGLLPSERTENLVVGFNPSQLLGQQEQHVLWVNCEHAEGFWNKNYIKLQTWNTLILL